MSEGKSQPQKRFPLTLDRITGAADRKKTTAMPQMKNPQTATQNIVRHSTPTPPLANSIRPAADRTANSPLVSDAVRKAMVQRLAQQGIRDPAVLAAMEAVPRHYFLEPGLASQAYIDASLPIGYHQTISQPYIVARMIEVMRGGMSGKLSRVLEIGTGCGYQAALLAQLATEVYSIERLRGLHDRARDNLRPLRVANLHLLFGDGMVGYAKGAPYAAIIAAAGGEALPQAWLDQLAVGGRLVAPLQAANGAQALVVVDKTERGLTQTLLEAVHFVPLKSGTS
jgi:protein-L-isoaspartate(D-aspartate) O-methyltransferase